MNTAAAPGTEHSKEARSNAEEASVNTMDSGLTLEALTQMDAVQLTELYESGKLPTSMKNLNGSPPGRMLATVGWTGRGLPATLLRRLAASRFFPWEGKDFGAEHDDEGWGKNRLIKLGAYFPFKTRIEPSVVDGKPCIVLDYDNPQNPWVIRIVHDELREVAPNLFLGPAMIKTKTSPVLVLFFAVDKTAN